jgi:2-dehydro-3-deoxy-D-gluconate 5-dehydrogenase
MAQGPLADLLRVDGQGAIVTGGAKGIGRGIVERLAEAGARVVIADIDEEAGRAAAQEIGVEFVRTNMASPDDIERLVTEAQSRLGRLDILVNNAGVYPFGLALEMSVEDWDRVQAINLRGLFVLSRAFANAVIAGGGGAIVNIGSIDSLHPSSVGLAAYDASKGGVLMFTRSFALEVAPRGIRVNMIAPGGITTEGVSATQGNVPADLLEQFLSRVPLGRWGVPDDIATMALVLVTPLSAYMTGANVVVDGGRLLA